MIGQNLNVNHDYHQRMLNLAEGSLETPITAKARPYYNLIYRLVKPGTVLVVGAGSGNDVASALRHGASRVDAVEIDPLILKLGKALHPERPYDSNRVRIVNNDARAFFKQSQDKYDLIVFGLLDSQTLLSSMSSIRLDNYIYTLESLREARAHLNEGGTVSLSFALTETWIQERFYRMLKEAFQTEPLCLETPYDAGISYVVGPTATPDHIRGHADLEAMVINQRIPQTGTPLPTDDWPFLYLRTKSIPFAYWFTLTVLFLCCSFWIRKTLASAQTPFSWYFFFLGAGFMLIEVKSISDLSLLIRIDLGGELGCHFGHTAHDPAGECRGRPLEAAFGQLGLCRPGSLPPGDLFPETGFALRIGCFLEDTRWRRYQRNAPVLRWHPFRLCLSDCEGYSRRIRRQSLGCFGGRNPGKLFHDRRHHVLELAGAGDLCAVSSSPPSTRLAIPEGAQDHGNSQVSDETETIRDSLSLGRFDPARLTPVYRFPLRFLCH